MVPTPEPPSAVVPIGDGPYALDLSADGSAAVVPLLIPAEDADPSLFWVDLESASVADRFRFGRGLFRVGTVDPGRLRSADGPGLPVVLVNRDVDRLTLAQLASVEEVAQVRSGQNPSNVTVAWSDRDALIGNEGYGLNGQNGGSISCNGANDISAIERGNAPGDVTGCNWVSAEQPAGHECDVLLQVTPAG